MTPHAPDPGRTGTAHSPQHRRGGKSRADTELQGSKRQLRRLHYAKVQALYSRRLSEAAKIAIEGTWEKSNVPKLGPDEIMSYWRGILEGPKAEDGGGFALTGSIQSSERQWHQ